MKRMISVLAVAALMAAMLAGSASAALATPELFTGGGSKGKGAEVLHCKALAEAMLPVLVPVQKGNVSFPASGEDRVEGNRCRLA